MQRDIVVLVSDSHGGSKNGLLNPSVEIYETILGETKSTFTPNPIQEYLWEIYMWAMDEIERMAKKSPIHLIHNGDITQGTKRPKELVSNRLADHILIGGANLVPWFSMKNLKTVRVVKGTGSHEFEEGSSSILVADKLKEKYKKVDVGCLYHGWASVGGVGIDFSHHGVSTGNSVWTKGNSLRTYMRNVMLEDISVGSTPPDLIVRSHYHSYIEEDVRVGQYHSKGIITPAMCWIDDYATQAGRSPSRISNGVIAVEIVNGKIEEVIPFIKTADLRTREVW